MKIIVIDGRRWRIVKQSENRIILHPCVRRGGEVVRAARIQSGLSVRAAARILGIDTGNLWKIENGERNCLPKLLKRLPRLSREVR